MKRVVFVSLVITHYREKFHNTVRNILTEKGVEYNLVYSRPKGNDARKRDTVDINWAERVPSVVYKSSNKMVLQFAGKHLFGNDLIIIGQENRFVLNYFLCSVRFLLRGKIAYWGHGRNFQSRRPDGRGERWKRFWATKVDWWFAYTDETRRHMESLHFPPERITVFNNAVDTSEVHSLVKKVTLDRLATLRTEMGLVGRHVGVFVGGIYPDKRMPFLVAAADNIREQIPDFEMLVLGGGTDLPVIEALAKVRPWIHVLGPRFGMEKIELMLLGHIFLMPGLMGLAILDAGVVGLPIATTRYPWHSPEIAYLSSGENGIMVDNWEDPRAYADAVVNILINPVQRQAMSDQARQMAERFSIEAMAQNFAAGVMKALEA